MRVWRCVLASAALMACSPQAEEASDNRLLIAPHINGAAFCQAAADNPQIVSTEDAVAYCVARGENAASRIEAALDAVGPAESPSGHYALGYMLSFPMMRYMTRRGGGWEIDRAVLQNDVNLIRDVNRPVVLLFSANHFTPTGHEISAELAADDRNLMWTRNGPLRGDDYFGIPLTAWTIADDEAPITQLRRRLFMAAAEAICELDEASRQRIEGVALLGEVHQLFPDLIQGTGFDVSFDVTDYSPASIAGFRAFLEARFTTVTALNAALGSDFRNFGDVEPPATDVLAEGGDVLDHLDASAAGNLAVNGWAFSQSGAPVRMALLIDGSQVAETIADLNRPDVSTANTSAPSPNVGWRFDFDYTSLAPGPHTLQVIAIGPNGTEVRFGARRFWVGADHQDDLPDVPAGTPPARGLHVNLDYPPGDLRVLYNPMAALWLEYRNDQVRDYYEQFARLLRETCLRDVPMHSHQMPPQLNPNWNHDLMAVSASEQNNALYLPGADLYDGAAFGDAFFRMKEELGWGAYGVGELNPSYALSVREMEAMLNRHRVNGARFVSPFFFSIAPEQVWAIVPDTPLRRMQIAPDNPHAETGAAAFYAAIENVMRDD